MTKAPKSARNYLQKKRHAIIKRIDDLKRELNAIEVILQNIKPT